MSCALLVARLMEAGHRSRPPERRSNAMPRYLISFDDGSMDHIPAEDWPAVGEAAHAVVREAVTADVKLTRSAELIVTHLGEDGGFCAADADSGASSGDSGVGPTRDDGARDRAANGVVSEHGATVHPRTGA